MAFKRVIIRRVGPLFWLLGTNETMRYVAETFLASTLLRGKAIAQFMGGGAGAGERTIRWIELLPTRDSLEVWLFESDDIGDEEFCDIGEFGGDDDEAPIANFNSPEEALEFAYTKLGASRNRWVNESMVGDEYRDYVVAGRPAKWPPVGA